MKAKELMARLNAVISRIAYKDWSFILGERHNVPYLQVSFRAISSTTGEPSIQQGRRWMLSEDMSPSEVVQTALKAVLTAEEHEARETFTYRDVPVFGPHLNVDEIVQSRQSVEHRLGQLQSLDPFYDLL